MSENDMLAGTAMFTFSICVDSISFTLNEAFQMFFHDFYLFITLKYFQFHKLDMQNECHNFPFVQSAKRPCVPKQQCFITYVYVFQ